MWTKEQARMYYIKNSDRLKKIANKNNKLRRERNRKALLEYLLAHHCIDCGEKDIVLLEFDHKKLRGRKNPCITSLINGSTWDVISKEITLCDIRCANCHTRKTAKQFNWWRLKYSK